MEKRLKVLDPVFSFHTYIETQQYVAVDFYQKTPLNELDEKFWGSSRSKPPKEYVLGSHIDSITNGFILVQLHLVYWVVNWIILFQNGMPIKPFIKLQ